MAAAKEFAGPVALRAIANDPAPRSDAGAVRLDLRSGGGVRRAAREIRAAFRDEGRPLDGFAVQPMLEGGVELLVGVTHEPSFGPVIVCSVGAPTAEVSRELAVRITPLTDVDAREMARSLRRFLRSASGQPVWHSEALEDVLLRLSALVEAHAEIAELELDPLVVLADGPRVVDARVRLESPPTPRPPLALRD